MGRPNISFARQQGAEGRKIAQPKTFGSLRLLESPQQTQSRRKFLRFFPGAFRDETYLDWERNYKWDAHRQWNELLGFTEYRVLLERGKFSEIASRALRIESRTNLLFSFEKMAIRDAVKSPAGAKAFSAGLYEFLHGAGTPESRFESWSDVVGRLPRKQTRVLTWPVLTVFSFIAQPDRHIFLKPKVTNVAAQTYGFEFQYHSRPSWSTYAGLIEFATVIRRNLRDLRPRDMIDIQSFIWVLGSAEYEE
jgi:hypothetical protein